jgi:hypothetical protein
MRTACEDEGAAGGRPPRQGPTTRLRQCCWMTPEPHTETTGCAYALRVGPVEPQLHVVVHGELNGAEPAATQRCERPFVLHVRHGRRSVVRRSLLPGLDFAERIAVAGFARRPVRTLSARSPPNFRLTRSTDCRRSPISVRADLLSGMHERRGSLLLAAS